MKRGEVVKYFWEELNAYTMNRHDFNPTFIELVNASIERAIVRANNKGKLISQIIKAKKAKK